MGAGDAPGCSAFTRNCAQCARAALLTAAQRCGAHPAGYARVAAVTGAFAKAFTDQELALALYMAAFVCDELVRVRSRRAAARAGVTCGDAHATGAMRPNCDARARAAVPLRRPTRGRVPAVLSAGQCARERGFLMRSWGSAC